MRLRTLALAAVVLSAVPAVAQDRATRVRGDRDTFAESLTWIYNDLGEGMAAAREQDKPLMAVVRCIPCEACQEFDDDVARRDPVIRDLMDRFVCVRLVQANTLDLSTFQYDYDQSMAIVFLHPDGTILGRFGTRSERHETEDISLLGLRAAMEETLRLFASYDDVRPSLRGKQPGPAEYATPLEYPSIAGRYGETLDYEGEVVESCLHCHQVREAERLVYRDAGEPIPDEVLFPYPDPTALGLKLDPESLVVVEEVAPGSPADEAGIAVGDRLASVEGQPLVSTADLQWILHQTPSGPAELEAEVGRGDGRVATTLGLPDDWRRSGNISWRVSTWDLRRQAFGGMKLSDLDDERRDELGLGEDSMALHADHVGQYGEHAVAKRAGLEIGDVLLAFDGQEGRMTESELLAHVLRNRSPGDHIDLRVRKADGSVEDARIRLP
ncbi:Trx7/PDZ domain-containing (seleno)protein [Tautonia plasticadhaerens]|uniref:Zinc metallopeptidase RseP n=1 Tax=Tautonia plasticadhaerens TaxID=2527974 RepID=A0A518GX86_9BACT|nr:Trx7/PDZ domain-containing (seleno)protein [Tautonia plasticadhaerens]QDV33182.1 zinc metallopeptidase RseP [Tautonia plasticadhaerens]